MFGARMFRITPMDRTERALAGSAFATLLGLTAGHTLLETARDALFLSRVSPAQLPWLYLAVAILGVSATLLSRANRARPRRFALAAALGGAALVTFAFWLLRDRQSLFFVYALFGWTGLFASWVTVQLWTLLGHSFDVTQAKRLYGFVGAGAVIGAVIGPLGARVLTARLATPHLLLAAALVFALVGLGPALLLGSRAAALPGARAAVAEPATATGDLSLVSSSRYVRHLAALVLLSTIALTLVDYMFKREVALHVAPAQMGHFFATFYAAVGALALIAQLFGVEPVLRLFGVHRALWVFPSLLLFGATGLLVAGALVATLVLKTADGALRHSLHRTSLELLYVPLPDGVRRRAKPVIDLLGQRGGQAAASLLILAVVGADGSRGGRLLLLLVLPVSLVAWLVVARGLRPIYVELFRTTLREGSLMPQWGLPKLDLDALETIFAALNSRTDDEVLAALELLAAQSRARLIPALVLFHPSRAVVLRALDIFVQEGRKDFIPIADRLLSHQDGAVAAAALRARTAVAPDRELLERSAVGACSPLQATAIAALVAHGWEAKGAASLTEFAAQAPLEARVALAAAITELLREGLGNEPTGTGERATARGDRLAAIRARFEGALMVLADAPEKAVAASAARALGTLRSELAIPRLIRMLGSRSLRPDARQALATIGPPAFVALSAALADHTLDVGVRGNIPRALVEIDAAQASTQLMRALLEEPDGFLRFRVLRALGRLRRFDPNLTLDSKILETAVDRTFEAAFSSLHWRLEFRRHRDEEPARETPSHELICSLLVDRYTHAVERVFRLLSLRYPQEDFERVYRSLRSRDNRQRGNALELLENLLVGRVRDLTLLLVAPMEDGDRLRRAAALVPEHGATLTFEVLLHQMMAAGGSLSVLAAYHAQEFAVSTVAPAPSLVRPATPAAGGLLDGRPAFAG